MSTHAKARSLFDPAIVRGALADSFRKLDPRIQVRNPVMFVVLVGSVLTTGLFVQALIGKGEAPAWFIFAVSLWLWFTVLFANFAEAMAEGRGKAQAEASGRRGATSPPRSSPTRLVAGSIPHRPGTRTRRARSCARATSCSSPRESSSRATARSSTASPRWTRAPSPARARR